MEGSQARTCVSLDGELVTDGDAALSVYDHAILYGDGVFDTVVVWDQCIYRYRDHYSRLLRSMKAVGIESFFSDEDLQKWTSETVVAQGIENAYVKWIVTRGSNGTPLMDPAGCKARLIILVKPYIERFDGSAPQGITLKTAAIRRVPAECLDPKIKSLNYLNLVQAKLEGKAAGADEALILDVRGNVCEAPGYNIFMVKGTAVCTPERDILEGVTRQSVIEMAQARSLEVHIGDFSLYDVYTAAEVFLTSTAGGLIPVTLVDGRKIAEGLPGPFFRMFAEEYGVRLRDPKNGVALKFPINSGENQ